MQFRGVSVALYIYIFEGFCGGILFTSLLGFFVVAVSGDATCAVAYLLSHQITNPSAIKRIQSHVKVLCVYFSKYLYIVLKIS